MYLFRKCYMGFCIPRRTVIDSFIFKVGRLTGADTETEQGELTITILMTCCGLYNGHQKPPPYFPPLQQRTMTLQIIPVFLPVAAVHCLPRDPFRSPSPSTLLSTSSATHTGGNQPLTSLFLRRTPLAMAPHLPDVTILTSRQKPH